MAIDWEAWKFLLGEWEGGHEGDPGQGYGTFSFSFALDQNILVRRNRTVFPATKERDGYAHDDLLIIYPEFSGTIRAIYFDNEEHVIHYEVNVSPDQKTITLESDPMPSAPQFRFTYIKTGEDSLEAKFEMAPPGAPGAFTMYLEGTAKRLSPK
ncbi:MAG: hypothetical protein WAM09_04935 [Anaerolineales bacterium]|jgi:hypothetical protein